MLNQRHSFFEDLFGIASGSVLLAVGIALLHSGGILTGGVAGLALMLAKSLELQVGNVFFALSLPFLILAFFKKSQRFAFRSAINLVFVSVLVNQLDGVVDFDIKNKIAVAVIANLMLGIGLIVIFRHYSSLGGFNVVALLLQEKFKIPAGYVQLVFDVLVLLTGIATYGVALVVISAFGAILLNISLAINHREDRYLGYSFKK